MIKICDSSIVKPLSIIFCNSLNSGIFPDNWKRSNIAPVHNKGNKQLIQNYRPVSLLLISRKSFERFVFNLLYKLVEENSLFCSNQSEFRKTDSYVNQLLSIVNEIYESFDNFPSLETRSEFLDMSKAFDRVWHEGLIYKLKTIGVSNNLLTLFKSSLDNRYQRALLNGQNYHWELIEAGVPQGSILGPLLFLIYINDLPNNLISNVKLFANDTSVFSIVNDINVSTKESNNDLKRISEWTYQ